MPRAFIFSIIGLFIVTSGCAPTYVEGIVTSQGGSIELNGARLEIPANSLTDTVTIRIEKRGIAKRSFDQGFALCGESFAILPETLVFQKPVILSYRVQGENVGIGAKIGSGFVPLVNAETSGGRLRASLWHGGEYYLLEKPQSYGIIDHEKSHEGLLIVCDIYVSNYVGDFKRALKRKGYDLPIWLFVYQPDVSVEDNARLLNEELKRLHNEYGVFRLDIVSFGIGGLVTHRYLTDSVYYQRDISSAVIAIGTPFFGSSFADLDKTWKGKNPFRFFFIDGMGDNAYLLVPESEFISRIREKRHLPGYHYYDDPSENKNFVSLNGQKVMDGALPEEISGDGLVSLGSAMLTPIEPAPFGLNHFELYESKGVHDVATDFVLLYRSFNWPLLFSSVWNGREPFSRVNETWAREAKLHFRDDNDFGALLEYNKNMLASTPQNAVLVTNGDYDTYPAWYLQENGVRSDVLIVNRSLFNLKDYARFLMRLGLPLDISEEELDQIKHKKTDDGFLTISDQLMQMLLKQTSRPVAISTTVYEPRKYGYPLKLSGLVYELGESDIDVERTKQLLYEIFEYESLSSRPISSFNVNIQNVAKNYAATAFSLSSALDKPGEYEEAIRAIEFAKRFAEEPMFFYNEALIYFKMGKKPKADSVLEKLLEMEAKDVKLLKEVARIYSENGMGDKAVKILAGYLREHPEEKEILDLIEKYQEE